MGDYVTEFHGKRQKWSDFLMDCLERGYITFGSDDPGDDGDGVHDGNDEDDDYDGIVERSIYTNDPTHGITERHLPGCSSGDYDGLNESTVPLD